MRYLVEKRNWKGMVTVNEAIFYWSDETQSGLIKKSLYSFGILKSIFLF